MVSEGSVGRKRKLSFWQVIVGLLASLAIGGWIGARRVTALANDRLDTELARLRAMGVPTTPEELRRPVDVNQNAALGYKKAILSLGEHGEAPRAQPFQGRAALESPEYRKWVQANADTLRIVEGASTKSGCDFNRQWERGAALDFPETSSLRSFASLAVAKAHYEAQEGRVDAAFHWLEVGRRVGLHLREPSLVGQMVATSSEVTVLSEVQRLTVLRGQNPEFRQKARKFLEGMGNLPSIRDALFGECVSTHVTLTQVENGSLDLSDLAGQTTQSDADPEVSPKFKAMAFKFPGVLQDAQATVLSSYRVAIEEMGKDPNDYRSVMEAIQALDSRSTSGANSLSGELAAIFVPTLSQAASLVVRAEAMRRLTRCGIELYESKGKAASFPAQLTAAPWTVDPFTERPFVYRPSEAGFSLYSVGPNGADNGGRSRFMHPMAPKSDNDDLEFLGPRR